jgi:uncharacterized lipoprotein YajG
MKHINQVIYDLEISVTQQLNNTGIVPKDNEVKTVVNEYLKNVISDMINNKSAITDLINEYNRIK